MAENGTIAYVTEMPHCDICKHVGTQSEKDSPAKAVADLVCKDGRWAYVCQPHRETHAMYPDRYGLGIGQELKLRVA